MKTYGATVRSRRRLSKHLVSVSLEVDEPFVSTGIPDEYLRVLIPPDGAELALPTIDENLAFTYPDGAVEPEPRVYTVSDHRIVDGRHQIDVDVVVHEVGIGARWAADCAPGDRVGLTEPHGLYAAPADVPWQLLVCDLTGVPALSRILRGLRAGQRAEVVVVVTDPTDEIALPSAADVTVDWVAVTDERDVADALAAAVTERDLPTEGRYVWLAGEARASRVVRKHLRRTLGWPQSDFYTCGYWQVDAEKWNARYEEVAPQIEGEAMVAWRKSQETGDDGAYLDTLDELYERVGL